MRYTYLYSSEIYVVKIKLYHLPERQNVDNTFQSLF